MIPDETIARIRDSVNLAELVREHVPQLKKTGRNFMARCPFHQERTPSFSVNPEMGVFKCFGCGVGGDAFKFVMLTEGLTYPEAIRKLAARVGVPIEEQRREELSEEARAKQVLYQLLEETARFYHRVLRESGDAQWARAYLEKRGLTAETLERFQIGWAPSSGQALREAAGKKGWSVEVLEKAGLLRRQAERGRLVDHFWNRITFPIWDAQGRVIGFGGRAMGDALPKYINSPETPVYSKSRHLYGLFQALPAFRKHRHLVILEGYMDVVTCHQFGLTQTAATLGTALTADHVRLLRRYGDTVTLLFDPDAAGAQASWRGGELLMAEGLQVKVVTLPDNLDADELLLRDGRAALERCLAEAVPFLDYCLHQALKRHPGGTPDAKLAVAKEFLPLLSKASDPLIQDEYLTRAAEALRVDKTVLGRQLRQGQTRAAAKGSLQDSAAPAPNRPALLSVEEEILLLALCYPSAEVSARLQGMDWENPSCRDAWAILAPQVGQGAVRLEEAARSLGAARQEWLTSLVMQSRTYGKPLEVLDRLLESWARRKDAALWRGLEPEIQAMMEGRAPRDADKIRKFNELSRRLKGSPETGELVKEASRHG